MVNSGLLLTCTGNFWVLVVANHCIRKRMLQHPTSFSCLKNTPHALLLSPPRKKKGKKVQHPKVCTTLVFFPTDAM